VHEENIILYHTISDPLIHGADLISNRDKTHATFLGRYHRTRLAIPILHAAHIGLAASALPSSHTRGAQQTAGACPGAWRPMVPLRAERRHSARGRCSRSSRGVDRTGGGIGQRAAQTDRALRNRPVVREPPWHPRIPSRLFVSEPGARTVTHGR
jgi:hypothetical protein